MPISLNNLANELINWCASDAAKASNHSWSDEQHVMSDFANYLNEKTNIKASEGVAVTKLPHNNHLFLFEGNANNNNGIIVNFLYDGDQEVNQLMDFVNETSYKFNKSNIEESFQSSIRCIVGVYNDFNNRRKFHDEEFIEVFNDFGVGCAIKRLQ